MSKLNKLPLIVMESL